MTNELIADARILIDDCRTYNFGLRNADRLAHEIAPRLADALEAAEAWITELEAGIEWEYQCTNNINTTGVLGDPEIHAKQCAGRIERRRKAGPWQPVESETPHYNQSATRVQSELNSAPVESDVDEA